VRRYTLQVSSFQARSEAESMMRQLESSGLRPYLISSYIPRRGMWYRIRVGDFPSRTKAKRAKKEFERRWRMTAYVTRMN
jgi:cell division septation protein DedD